MVTLYGIYEAYNLVADTAAFGKDAADMRSAKESRNSKEDLFKAIDETTSETELQDAFDKYETNESDSNHNSRELANSGVELNDALFDKASGPSGDVEGAVEKLCRD